MSKKRSPAYYRYKEKHPTVSVVLTKDLKTALDKYKGGLSYGQAIKKLLTEKLDPYQEGYNKGYKKGYNNGENEAMESSAKYYEEVLKK